jgi:hypothetical protein
MDKRALTFLGFNKNKAADNYHNVSSYFRKHFSIRLIPGYILCSFIITAAQTYAQQNWLSFSGNNLKSNQQQEQLLSNNQNTKLLSSGSSSVAFTVHVDGMSVNAKDFGPKSYQGLSIPGADALTSAGYPQLPMIIKLIAIPDCDNVNILVIPSNELNLNNYNVAPAPEFINEKISDESHPLLAVENKSIYSADSFYPGKYAEIIETGYVRSQKVARVAIYPVQFNPVKKAIQVYSDFNITLNFINSKSPVNKETGIFRNMLNHAALNYEPNGLNASSKNLEILQNTKARKVVSSLSALGSITRINNTNQLTGTNALPVDYLIITHSSLYNSSSLTKLAGYRANYNGFDVAIVQVDSTVYDAYPGRPHYQSIRDFISDVYLKGISNHSGDGHLGYIVLVGDAYTDPPEQKEMVPSAYPSYYSQYEQGGDYYYACTGGDNDDLQDLIYGRISAGNEDELSNVVNKTIAYESAPPAAWQNNVSFMSYTPWFFNDDENCDSYFYLMAHSIPRSNYISYAWRGFAEDTSHAWGRLYFKNHSVDQASIANVPNDINEVYNQKFTGWRWYNYIISTNTNQPVLGGQYTDSIADCGAADFDNWIYNKLNQGQRFFVYEGHGGHGCLGAGEGAGRYIFRIDQMENRLNNYGKYAFIIANGCETGEFDSNSPDNLGNIDCLAEKTVNMKDAGAIGFLGSVRESSTSAFNHVDRYVLDAFYNNSSHIMGEAVMESKLLLFTTFRRQYNLYGDPAINLWNNTTFTSTSNDNNSSIIQGYELFQNFPNPFNPTTTISYQLPKDGNVSLIVYDVLGRELKRLVDCFKKAGKYNIGFDASKFSSGIYFYKLKSDGYSSIKKMILIK